MRESSCWRFQWNEIFVISFLSILILVWNLKNSFEFGRLAFAPSYDDVSYFVDALRRYHAFVNGGVPELLLNGVNNPPHAPIMALLGVFSYIVFGVQDWAPYILLCVIPFAALSAFFRFCGSDCSAWFKWCGALFLVTLPLVNASVVEFRPDILAGMLIGISIVVSVFYVTATDNESFAWSRGGVASLLALSLMAKPSAVIYNICLIVFALVFSSFLYLRQKKGGVAFRRAVGVVALGLVILLPYFYIAGRNLAIYIWNAVVRDKSIWAVDFDWVGHAKFYLLGHGGVFMLGWHVWVMCFVVVMFFVFFRRFDDVFRTRMLVVFSTVFVGYVVVASNPVKTQFLGVAFQSLWVIATLLVSRELTRVFNGKPAKVLLVLMSFLSLLSVKPVAYWGRGEDVKELVRSVAVELDNSGSKGKVFIAFTGFLNNDVLTYELLKKNIARFEFFSVFLRPEEGDVRQAFVDAISQSEFVVVASEGASVAQSPMPANKYLSLSLSMLKEDGGFSLVKEFPSGGGSVFLFKRNRV